MLVKFPPNKSEILCQDHLGWRSRSQRSVETRALRACWSTRSTQFWEGWPGALSTPTGKLTLEILPLALPSMLWCLRAHLQRLHWQPIWPVTQKRWNRRQRLWWGPAINPAHCEVVSRLDSPWAPLKIGQAEEGQWEIIMYYLGGIHEAGRPMFWVHILAPILLPFLPTGSWPGLSPSPSRAILPAKGSSRKAWLVVGR